MSAESDAAVMMTLSAISYQTDITWQLSQTGYATAGEWSLVWGPGSDDYGNLLYVAQSNEGAYAVAIRGSEISFSWTSVENWFYDFDVLFQAEWPYFGNSNADAVSSGAYVQAVHLTQITSGGQTLLAFLQANLTPSSPLYVTGHSLGGNLAIVLASWLSSQLGPAAGQSDPRTQVYSFAAPSPGNQSFAGAFNRRFPHSWRYLNSLDVAPHAWADILGVNTIWDGNSLPTPLVVQIIVLQMAGSLEFSEVAYDSFYEQTNAAGSVLPGVFTIGVDWYTEVGLQHWSNTYLSLLGAPAVNPGPAVAVAAALNGETMLPVVLKTPNSGTANSATMLRGRRSGRIRAGK